jgi:hypothetical protein
MYEPNVPRDPTRHFLKEARYERRPDGTEVAHPITLEEAAADLRRSVDAEDTVALGIEFPEEGDQVIAISSARALAIAALLGELSLRLQPGRAVGPIRSDDSLSRLAREVAQHLHDRT